MKWRLPPIIHRNFLQGQLIVYTENTFKINNIIFKINDINFHHVTEKKVKEKILMENPVLSNIKGTPLNNYIK